MPPSFPEIPLGDLPRWNAWPSRLLSLVPWNTPTRDLRKIEAEYNQDKYARCLALHDAAPERTTVADLRRFQLGKTAAEPLCVSLGDRLFRLTVDEALAQEDGYLLEAIGRALEGAGSVVELGCGYGRNLAALRDRFPSLSLHGGEYAENGVSLARRFGLTVGRFDFYDESYSLLEDAPAPIVVLTSFAVQMLPSAAPFLSALARHRHRLHAVVQLEPIMETYSDDLLSLLRRRYTEANDYNRDLLGKLRSDPRIELTELSPGLFGLNPLAPFSVLRWRFR